MTFTEHGVCDFCGDTKLVALSDSRRPKVRICWVCADWARDEITSAEVAAREQGGTGNAAG